MRKDTLYELILHLSKAAGIAQSLSSEDNWRIFSATSYMVCDAQDTQSLSIMLQEWVDECLTMVRES